MAVTYKKIIVAGANVSDLTNDSNFLTSVPNHSATLVTSGTFATARIPNLNTSKITAGTLPVARGGTGTTSGYNKSNWDTAYGWGNHASGGYSTATGVANNADVTGSNPCSQPLTTGTQTISGAKTFTNNIGMTGGAPNFTIQSTDTNNGDASLSLIADNGATNADFWKIRATAPDDELQFLNGNDSAMAKFHSSGTVTFTNNLTSPKAFVETGLTNGGLWVKEGTSNAFSIKSNGANGYLLFRDEYNSADRLKIEQSGEITIGGSISASSTITASGGNSGQWNTAYGWGNHANAGYLTSQTDSQSLSISGRQISLTNGGNVTVPASSSNDFTNTYKTYAGNGNTAHGWGNHASGGYASSSHTHSYDNYSSWKVKSHASLDSGADIVSGNSLIITGSGATSVSRSGKTLTITSTNTQYSVQDGGLTQKNFTTTLKNKLDGITAGADVTPSWVPSSNPGYLTSQTDSQTLSVSGKTVTISNGNSITTQDTTYSVQDGGLTQKNFTTTLKTKLDGIATGATNTSAPYYTSAISVGDGGLTQNNFTNTLKTKLDGIATQADKYASFNISASAFDGGGAIGSGQTLTIQGGTNAQVSRSGKTLTISATDTNTNTTYTAGTGMSLSGTTFNCTVVNTDTNTTYSAGTGLNLSTTTFGIANKGVDTNQLANNCITGTQLDSASINHPSKFDTGVVDSNAITSGAVGASELNVSGNGTSSQFLRSDGDGTMTWATPSGSSYTAGSGLDLSSNEFSIGEDSIAEEMLEAGCVSSGKFKTNTSGSSGQFLQLQGGGVGMGWSSALSSVDDGDWSGTDLSIANGGTGASTEATARRNLDVAQDGWMGSSTRIKIMPSDFMADSDSATYNYALTSADNGATGRIMHSSLEAIGSWVIPIGFKATHVMLYGNNARSYTVYQCYISNSTDSSLGSGSMNTLKNITDMTASTTNYMSIRMDLTGTNDRFYGGYITIAKV